MKRLFNIHDVYLLKFSIYGAIASYDYMVKSNFAMAWLMLAILSIVFWFRGEVKLMIDKKNE